MRELMLISENIESRPVLFQGKSISIKQHCRLLKRRENAIPISRDAIEFCKSQIYPNNSWGIWYSIISSWRDMGLSNREIFQIILQANAWGSQYVIYGASKRELCMKILNDPELAEEYCRDAIKDPQKYGLSPYYSPSEGLIILARHNQLSENFYPLVTHRIPAHDLLFILTNIPENQRKEILLRLFSRENMTNHQGIITPKVVLHYAVPFLDLLPSDAEIFVNTMADELAQDKGNDPADIAKAELFIHHVKTKTPLKEERNASGMTKSAASVVGYLEEEFVKRQRIASFDAYQKWI